MRGKLKNVDKNFRRLYNYIESLGWRAVRPQKLMIRRNLQEFKTNYIKEKPWYDAAKHILVQVRLDISDWLYSMWQSVLSVPLRPLVC